MRILLEIEIAGRRFQESFLPLPNQTYTFVWDGLDAYGRKVVGNQTATVKIGYAYALIYLEPVPLLFASFNRAFGRASASGASIGWRPGVQGFVKFWKGWQVTLRAITPTATQLGDWSLSVHHASDALYGVYYSGDGTKRSAQNILRHLENEAKFRLFWWRSDGSPTTQVQLTSPRRVALAPDGSLFIADALVGRIRWVSPDGLITTVAGTG